MLNYTDVINYWFQGVDDQTEIKKGCVPFSRWFKINTECDKEIKEKFRDDIQRAREGLYDSWMEIPHGKLALIILFDQFTRNIYRGTKYMFFNDCRARRISVDMIQNRQEGELKLIEKIFLYMPLMHTEIIDYQEFSVKKFTSLLLESQVHCPHNQSYYANHLKYAKVYYETIKRHGRFPKRDKVLSRDKLNVSSTDCGCE